jgi:lysophospholipase
MLRIKTGKRSMWSVKLAVRWNLRHGKAGDYVLDDADDPFDHTFEKDALTSDESRYEQWRQQLLRLPASGRRRSDLGLAGRRPRRRRTRAQAQGPEGRAIPVAIVQAGEDDRVWKQTNKWAAKRLGRGRYVEVAGAKHEVIMETDDLRAVFLEEFDAMAAYVSPSRTCRPSPRNRSPNPPRFSASRRCRRPSPGRLSRKVIGD